MDGYNLLACLCNFMNLSITYLHVSDYPNSSCSDGIIDPLIPLKLSKYLKEEKHYIPWAMARAKLDCMTILLSDKKIKKLYKVFIMIDMIVFI